MKNFNLFSVMFIMLLILSECKKSPTTVVNKSATPPNTTTATTTNDASTAKTALIGHWVLDSLLYYNNGVVTITKMATAANSNNYTYDMLNAPYGAANQPQMQENYGLAGSGSQNAVSWCVQDVQYNTTGRLLLSSGGVYSAGYIILLTSNNLVVADNYAQTPQGYRYYLHK